VQFLILNIKSPTSDKSLGLASSGSALTEPEGGFGNKLHAFKAQIFH
jgi:hypothetical protein